MDAFDPSTSLSVGCLHLHLSTSQSVGIGCFSWQYHQFSYELSCSAGSQPCPHGELKFMNF